MQTSSSSNSQNSKKAIRRHDIDWLRVILFGLLIPFHVALEFTGRLMVQKSIQILKKYLEKIERNLLKIITTTP